MTLDWLETDIFFPVNLDLLKFFVCKKFMVKSVVVFFFCGKIGGGCLS